MTEQFDVFLAHNSVDKPLVREISARLRERGLNPWLDEEQILAGELFQEAIQKAIPHIKSAAIIIGMSLIMDEYVGHLCEALIPYPEVLQIR